MTIEEQAQAETDVANRRKNAGWRFPVLKKRKESKREGAWATVYAIKVERGPK